MFRNPIQILYSIQLFLVYCKSLNVIDVRDFKEQDAANIKNADNVPKTPVVYEPYPFRSEQSNDEASETGNRRYWLVHDQAEEPIYLKSKNVYEDEKDANIKTKISALVQQTMKDTERRMKTVLNLKEKHRDEAPYKAGFVLSLVKKSQDVLNELFNVAVKHREEWKALEQLKIFELIMHTNVDTTNLVKQLVNIHLNYMNATSDSKATAKKSLILL